MESNSRDLSIDEPTLLSAHNATVLSGFTTVAWNGKTMSLSPANEKILSQTSNTSWSEKKWCVGLQKIARLPHEPKMRFNSSHGEHVDQR